MPLTQHDFDKHVASIKTIVAARAIRLPSCFISYAWEASKDQNEKLQTWLKKLKQDLETVGIKTFLDICQMNGDMRECMQENIRKSDYILLIGTERFKYRIEEDRLYKTSRDSFNAYKKHFVLSPETCIQMYKSFVQGKAVVFIEDQGTNFIAFIENGKVLLEIPVPQEMKSEFGRMRWLPKDALVIHVAGLNKAAYEIIDQAKKEINFKLSAKPIGNSVTNVAFEFGFALEKKEHHPNTIIPLLYSGDFRTSFPEKIFDILIRDMRDSINYYDLLIGLNNPLGIIPAMCSELVCSEEYKELLNGQNQDKPEIKFGQRGKEHVMYTNITPDGLVTLDFSISAAELTTEQELGRGGYGIVYLGKRKHNHVAIKQLTTAMVSKEELSEFNKEAIIMAQLGRQCPQLVQLFGICFEEPYRLVMELLIRGSLYSLLRNHRTLDWKLKSNIARDVAIGLDFLHDHNVIHRDIKSSNILLGKDFSAKLSDYGLAKIKENSTSTSVGQAVGTLPWMAPELIAEEYEPLYSIYSDIYSYGLVLLEMATHKTPFEGIKNSVSLKDKIINGIAEPIPPETPLHFVELINKCRNKLAENRPNTASIIQLLSQQQKLNPAKLILFSGESPISSVGYSRSSQVKPEQLSSASISSRVSSSKTESTELEKMKLSNFLEHRKPRIPTIQAAKSKPAAIINVSPQAVLQFLHHVGYGEQAEAEAMLQKDKNLALAHGDLTDCSVEPKTYRPRTWKNITGFQYAILALDYQMWTMIQKYINTEEARKQIAEITNKATLKDKEGWIIKPEDTDWPQTGWSPLIEALDIYVKNYGSWGKKQRKIHWNQQVGGTQLILAAHMINEYISSRPFYPCPKWQGEGESLLPRTGVADWIKNNGRLGVLGINCTWAKGTLEWATCGDELDLSFFENWAEFDSRACVELLKSRTEQAQALVFKLTSSSHNVLLPISSAKCGDFSSPQANDLESLEEKLKEYLEILLASNIRIQELFQEKTLQIMNLKTQLTPRQLEQFEDEFAEYLSNKQKSKQLVDKSEQQEELYNMPPKIAKLKEAIQFLSGIDVAMQRELEILMYQITNLRTKIISCTIKNLQHIKNDLQQSKQPIPLDIILEKSQELLTILAKTKNLPLVIHSKQELESIIGLIFNRMNEFLENFKKEEKDMNDFSKIIEIDKLLKNNEDALQNQSISIIHNNVISKLDEMFAELENFYEGEMKKTYIIMNKRCIELARKLNGIKIHAKALQINLKPFLDIKENSINPSSYSQKISKIIEMLDSNLFTKVDTYQLVLNKLSAIASQCLAISKNMISLSRKVAWAKGQLLAAESKQGLIDGTPKAKGEIEEDLTQDQLVQVGVDETSERSDIESTLAQNLTLYGGGDKDWVTSGSSNQRQKMFLKP